MKRLNLDAVRRELERPDISPEDKAWLEEQTQAYLAVLEANPLQGFDAHSKAQRAFLEARTPVQAAFCGNQFGKTCALVVKAYAQHLPDAALPSHLKKLKVNQNSPAFGYLLCPAFKLLDTVYLPELRKWAPKQYLRGGSFDKAWDKTNRALHFEDGGQLHVFTYEQTADKLVGARLDYIAYDEPPPQPIRDECAMRLTARGGFEMFAMTPVNISGGGIGWVHNEIWLKREDPQITVVNGSIHDNPLLDKETVERTLARYTDEQRRAREFGEFVHIGGMVYGASGGFERVLVDPPSTEQVEDLDVVVGIDPGLKNAAFIWVGFDGDNRAFVFDELLLQEKTADAYAAAIRRTNKKWGLTDPLYVIDPSARNRSLTNAESVEGELQRRGIYTMHGQNAVEAGVQNIRSRIIRKAFFVSRECRGLRGEADLYRMQDDPSGEFRVVKENDHRLDACRYAVMTRAWDPATAMEQPKNELGWQPDVALSQDELDDLYEPPALPMGSMS